MAIKKALLSIFILCSVFFTTNKVAYALSSEITDINDKTSLEIGEISFSNIIFKDYSNTSTRDFGLIGNVTNNSNSNIDYNSIIYYYDQNNNAIALSSIAKSVQPGISSFSQMSDLSILNGHNINEIQYYKLQVSISNYTNSSLNTLIPSNMNEYDLYDYVIDNYDIDIIVNENNTFDITENITVYFNRPRHGIIRSIPRKNNVIRLDGTSSKNRAEVSNIYVDNDYKFSKKSDMYNIKIGSDNETVTGKQHYTIKYTYNIGKDPMKDYDELYYNLIGTQWDTVIGNITFTITMPKEFDASRLGFSSGSKGLTDNDKVKYTINGNKITGSFNGILNKNEALTIRCELPEGYFVGAGFKISLSIYLMFIIPIIFLIISLLLWYKFGRDNQVIETVEFYPPEGFNSLDVGFLYKGKAESKDVTSLLIYLANKGYIEINDNKIDLNQDKINLSEDAKDNANRKILELQNKINEEKRNNPDSNKIKYYENMLNIYKEIDKPIDYNQYGLKSSIKKENKKNEFVIKKLKDYDGDNVNEQMFMDGIFKLGRTEVTDKMLYNDFYITNNQILCNINCKKNKDKIFEKGTSGKSIIILLLMVISSIVTIIIPTIEYAGINGLGIILLDCVFYLPFFAVAIFKKSFVLLGFIFFHSFFFINSLPIVEVITTDNTYLLGFIVGMGCLLGMIICLKLMPKRTQYGNEILGKLRGFKNFLETVEKEKLESMVVQNPNYFYDILPYTYVLGVSDKWIKKFESISLQAPNWYGSSNAFDVVTFGTFINSTMIIARSVMSSSPSSNSGGGSSGSSSSGGGSSGGGSSGGGSGGGGGSSW